MSVGFLYDGSGSVQDLLSFIVAGKKGGLDSVWIAEHLMYRESLIIASIILQQTETLKVFPGPISPYTMHPVVISMVASTLSEIGKERFGLVLGTGDKATLNYLGVKVINPISTIREAVRIIQALCAGEVVQETNIWNLENVRLVTPSETKIPIYLTGIGSKMLTLAQQIADGLVLSAATSPEFIRYSLNLIKDIPKNNKTFGRIGFILASVNNDYNKALAQIKPKLAFMLRGSYLKVDWQLNNLNIDGDAIQDALDTRNDLEAACNLISETDVKTLTAAGTPDAFQRKLQEYMDAGIDYPVMLPVGNISDKLRVIELAIEVCS